MKIVFLGTPEFSVPCLRAMCEAGYDVRLAVTQPDKPKGRGMALTPPPVKIFAEANGIPVFQPSTLRDGFAEKRISEENPDLIVVVAYGKILPESILKLPPLGCINVHASLLPRHRGASPIQSAILCGDNVTGVTTMQMDAGLDTGDILLSRSVPIGSEDTAVQLHDRLSDLGAEVLLETLEGLRAGRLTPQKQDEEKATYCTVLKREMGHLDFTESAVAIHNRVRGLYDWPAAYAFLNNKRIKILKTRLAGSCPFPPGRTYSVNGGWYAACGDGEAVELLEVQLEGSRRMAGRDALLGHPLAPDDIFC